WKTTYRYDLLDNFAGYTDSQNNQKLIEYDGLGRKTFMNDPDRGHMHYRYDEAGNLERTIDAKQQTIRYQYDGVNRLEKEFYSAGLATPDVVYHYDAPKGPLGRGNYWGQASRIARDIHDSSSTKLPHDIDADGIVDVANVMTAAKTDQAENVTANNTLGKLAWVEDQSGQEHLSYDNRGRVEWKIKRINDRQSITHAFYSANRYDTMDRVTRYTYPDGSYMNYQYNNRGLLESVPGVIDRCDYNEAGQNALQALANGVTTFYSYDGRLRLKRLQSKRGSDMLILQDLNYKYDNVSNITTITDERDAATLNAIGDELGIENLEAQKFNATQTFEYDDLYRLTKSANGSIYGHIEYRYDRIGNLVRLDAANLLVPKPALNLGEVSNGGVAGAWNRNGRDASDPPGPHALTGTEKDSFGGGLFSYDSNGNMINYGETNLDWDYLDRLITVDNFNSKAEYRYDYLGKRKVKTLVNLNDTGKIVVYIDKYSEIRNGRLHKYIYSGSKRVAEKRGVRPNGRTWLYAYYLHDHLGSANLLLSAGGVIEEYFESYSYGHMRKEVVNSSGGSDSRYKYTGKEYDEESGYMYFGDRYYLSNIGAFISVDKAYTSDLAGVEGAYGYLVNPQILSIYRYAVNNPTLNVDNDGRSAAVAGALVGGIAGALVSGASELLTQQGTTDWSAVRAAAYKGAVGGAVAGGITAAAVGAGLTLGGSLALDAAVIGTVAGSAGGFSGKAFENMRNNLQSDKPLFQGITFGTLSATLGGAFGGAIAGPVGQRISVGLANRFGKNTFKQINEYLPDYGHIGFFEKVVGAPNVGPAFTGAGAVGGAAAGEMIERSLKLVSP
ncbi:MAG: hypothetical protein KUF72_07670, partial [Candidatus Thiodiazotropha sp. (ex Ctena orbiculata)]|nr:hypothetical protein [Candidatus Thiodiazotropha taylori]